MAHETPEDIAELQRVLDLSHASAGTHLLRIFSEERRVPAAELPERLRGAQVLALATVTARGEPRVAPVDGHLYRGKLWFGSAQDSMRFRHIRARPHVSATHVPGEELAVTVHGRAVPVEIKSGGFRESLLEVYVPRYGPAWEHDFLDSGPQYARIEADRMFTFHMSAS